LRVIPKLDAAAGIRARAAPVVCCWVSSASTRTFTSESTPWSTEPRTSESTFPEFCAKLAESIAEINTKVQSARPATSVIESDSLISLH
jgi:hypothetical protein